MKKILCLLGLLGVLSAPAMSKDVPYITNLPYKPYTKEIKLEKIASDSMQNDIVTIEKNKYAFYYIPKMGYAYEYNITNNTDSDIILKGVNALDFYNEDISNKSNKPLKNVMKSVATSGKIYIPFYGMYYGVKCDLEKNSFLRDFPQNQTIKSGAKIRILASATKEKDNPQAEFIFIIDNQEHNLSF